MKKTANSPTYDPVLEAGKMFYALNVGITTCYVLECTGGYLVIDTGFPKDYAKFLQRLAEVGIDQRRIRYLLLTHNHDDHVGFAARLRRETDAKCIVHRNALAPLREGKMDHTGIRPLNGIIAVLAVLHTVATRRDCRYEPVLLTEQDEVVDGDEAALLQRIGIEGEILYTPGHSTDSISVLMSGGQVFCGDAAMNYLNFAGPRHRPIFLADAQLVFASWQKMLERGAKIFYPAHGKPFGAERLRDSLKRFSPTTILPDRVR